MLEEPKSPGHYGFCRSAKVLCGLSSFCADGLKSVGPLPHASLAARKRCIDTLRPQHLAKNRPSHRQEKVVRRSKWQTVSFRLS